jgi:hypothetical protein
VLRGCLFELAGEEFHFHPIGSNTPENHDRFPTLGSTWFLLAFQLEKRCIHIL